MRILLLFILSKRFILPIFLIAFSLLVFLPVVRRHLFLDSKTFTTQTNKRIVEYGKTVVFPQAGGEVGWNQPWTTPAVNVWKRIPQLDKQTRYILGNFSYSSGLGNLMFQYAALRAIAANCGAQLLIPNDCLIRRAFSVDAQIVDGGLYRQISQMSDTRKIIHMDCCRYNAQTCSAFVNRTRRVALIGYFQNYRYFYPEHQKLISNNMQFLPEILKRAHGYLEDARKLAKNNNQFPITFIGIHIRRGIDVSWNRRNLEHGHTVADRNYFIRAINHFKTRFENVIFLVCSDAIAWSRAQFRDYEDSMLFIDSGYREVDLSVLSLCNHTIASTGTFSWWAGYLAGGQTIYYRNWPRAGSPMQKMINTNEYFLPHWIAL